MSTLYSQLRWMIASAEGIPLCRGEPVIQDAPKERSHKGGIFFHDVRGKQNARGYSRAIQDGSMVGALRKLILPIAIYRRLANLHDDRVYAKLLPDEDDRSGDTTRGVMPDATLIRALHAHGYTGYKWLPPSGGLTEYFILTDALRGLKYEAL